MTDTDREVLSTDAYTPATSTVRASYARHASGPLYDERAEEFDRWITQHDREVQAEAFEAAAVRVRANFAEHGERCPWVGFLDDEAARIRKGATDRADAAKRVL